MSDTGMSAKDLAKEMGDDLSGEIKTYIKTCENGIYSTDGFKKAIGELGIADKAANVAFKGLMIAGNLLASMLASVLLTTIYKCITANSQLQKSAREIGQSFSESKSEIDDYQKKISELRDKINDSSSSYEETYQARENLLEIQDQMIAKFGSEADAIKNVTDAINGSDDAFKKLTRSEVDKAITKFNLGSDQSLAGTFANWWGHATKGYSSNWDTMLGDMENYTAQFRVEPHLDDKAYKEFEEKVKELFGGTRDRYDNGDDFIEISGNLDEVNHKLQGILALARDLGVDNSYISGLENAVNKTQNLYDSYKDIYDIHILNDKIFANDDYEKAFSSIQDGYKTYQEEYKKGNQDAASDFVKTFNEATQNIDDEEIKKYFRRLYPDLQAEIGGWQFEVKFKAALADDSDNYEQNIQDALSKFDSVNAIEDYSPTSASSEQKEAYRVLQLAADKYDMSITQLIEHLSQMGYIASRTKNDLLHKLGGGTSPKGDTIGAFGMIIPSQEEMNAVSDEVKDWVNDLTEEEAKLANSKEFEKAVKERKQEIAGLSDAQANLRDEYQKIHDWRLDDYSEEIKNGTLPSKYGNIDMDNRTVIKYDENYLKEHENVLKSWVEEYDEITGEPIYTKYNEVADAIANGESLIDSVWGQSDRFGEDLNGVGWEIAFTPILPNGNFLSSDTVYDYIDSILKDAYANDGQVTADELTKLDAKGRMIGNTFVHGIFAAVDDSQNYDDNGNWADTVGRLMHFAGDDGAIKLATKAIDQANEAVRNGTLSAEDYAKVLEIVQKRLEKVSETNTDVPTFTKSMSEIQSLSKGLDIIAKIYADVSDKGTFDWSSILNNSDFTEIFGNMTNVTDEYKTAYDDFIKTVSNSPDDIDACQNAFDRLTTAYIYSSGKLDKVTEETKKAAVAFLEEKGVTNADAVVTDILAAKKAYLAETSKDLKDATTEEVVALLDEADVADDAKAAMARYQLQKLATNGITLNTDGDIKNIESLVSACGGGITALQALANAKKEIFNSVGTSPLMKDFQAKKNGKFNIYDPLAQAKWDADTTAKLDQATDAAMKEINSVLMNFGNKGGSATNSTKNKSGSGSGSSKDKTAEKQAETFNWMERMLEVIANQHDKINDYVSDETKSIDAQQAKLSEIIAIDQQKMDVLKQQIEVYKQYWLKALSEIDEEQLKIYGNGMSKSDLISKITNGALDIQDFVLPEGATDAQETAYKKLVENIKNAQSAYQDVEDTEKKLDETEQDIADHQKERYEKRIEQIEAENDALKSRQDIIQADLDLLEASGGIELEGMYQELIDLSKQQMSLYEEEAAAARDRMSEVEAGSTEYYQLESKINDCTQSIKECQKEQAEWQETIKRLPIERIQKYINMLQNIKQDLQNFIDEQNSLGISTTVDQYKQLMDICQKEIDKLLEQQKKLSGLLDTYQYGSEKFNDVQDEIQDIDNTISGLIQNMYEWNNSIMQIPIDQLSKVNEQLNLYSDSLGAVLEEYDSSLNAVTGTIDQQIDKINEMREATEKAYEEKIKPLQTELDLLEKNSEARSKILAIEQSQYSLEKAKNQESNKVIRNGEISYEADQDAIRQADQEYQNALLEKKKYDIQSQIDSLEEERDKLLEGYDQQIDALDKISDRWTKIKDQIQLAADTIKATNLFGEGWQDKVLSGKDDDLYNMFKQLYESTSTEKDKVDEQIASNERIVTMMQRFVELYQDGSITYEKAMAGITQMANQMKDGYSALEQLNGLMNIDGIGKISDISASTNAKVDQSVQLLGEYMGIAKANSDTISQYTSTWNEMKDNIAAQLAQLEKMAKELEEYVKNHTYSSGSSSSSRDHDSGSSSSSGGGSGNNYVAAGPGYSDEGMQEAINRGDRIEFDGSGGGKTEQEIKDTYKEMTKNKRHTGVEKGPVGGNGDSNDKYAKLAKELGLKSIKPYEYPAFLKQGEIVFTQEQMKQMGQNLQALSTPKYMTVPDNVIKRTDQSTNIDFKMGDVVLNNVQDVDGFAKAVSQTFKSKMRQELTVQRW